MMKSIRLKDSLFELAEKESSLLSRSIAGQIEHWINIGRAAEVLYGGNVKEILAISHYEEMDLEDYKKSLQHNFEVQVRLGLSKSSDAYLGITRIAKNAKIEYRDVDY